VTSEYKLRAVRTLGPDSARLSIRTARLGAASKAGHDLLIEVGAWEGKLDTEPPSVWLKVDSTSLRVLEGTGGIQKLGDDDKENIEQTIDDEVLKKQDIEFQSNDVKVDGENWTVTGDLTLVGRTHPVNFDLVVREDGTLSGSAVVKQTDWGMKPYTAFWGALKVADEVKVELEAGPES
jgi:hypothetical protein